jgi:TPP-dependent pyruvate/acetoin dehydrogenase alpha subunit
LGAAFSFQYRKEPRIALTFTGDGASSEGAFSESLNLAAVLKLPVVFVLEDNQYAYSTPSNYQYAIPDLIARAAAFGLPGVTVHGNNILDVRNAVADAISRARNGEGPTLIKANTMRMEGHALHDSAEYVPTEMLDKWRKQDPISNYKSLLHNKQLLDDQTERSLTKQIENEVSDGVLWAENSPYPDPSTLTDGVYA